MKFTARKKDGKLVMSPDQAEMRDHYVGRWKEDSLFDIEITRICNPGSYQQLKTIFGLAIARILAVFAERGMDLGTFLRSEQIKPGLPVTKDVMKEYLYAVAGFVADDGSAKTLHEMTSVERSRFFEAIRTFAAAQWDIQIPDPDPNWQMKEIQKCVDRQA
jgi:hypothetical protein